MQPRPNRSQTLEIADARKKLFIQSDDTFAQIFMKPEDLELMKKQ